MKRIKSQLIYSSLAILSTFFIACNPESFNQIVEFDVPLEPSKLVVNCNYIIGEDSISVVIGQTRNVGETPKTNTIKDAKVELYKDNILLFTIPYDNQISSVYNLAIYRLNGVAAKITAGSNYTLKVSANGFESVEATQLGVNLPKVSNASFKIQGYTFTDFDRQGEKTDAINFDLTDPAGENYYQINVYKMILDTATGKIITDRSLSYDNIFYTDPQLSAGSIFDDLGVFNLMIDDAIFNEKKINLNFGVDGYEFAYYYDFNTGEYYIGRLYGYTLGIKAISKEKYQYELTVEANQNNSGNLFSEPVSVNSNIKNGFGVFSISNSLDVVAKKP